MLISINGVRTPADEATISIFDRGFLFGDAVYDVIRTSGRSLFQLEAHLHRLQRSGEAIGLDVASLRPALEDAIEGLLADSPPDGEVYVRIMITRGSSPDLDLLEASGPPCWIVIVKPLEPFESRLYREGIRLMSIRPDEIVGRIAPWVKSNNRQANVMAHRVAREQGHDDALFVDPEGNVTEGPTWNLFCVKDGAVATPPLAGGLLPGITRSLVVQLCAELGIDCQERALSLDEARSADELFITSTTRGVMPVGRLDGEAIGDGTVPGPVTARLADSLQTLEGGPV
jgi:branched-chain amino acid aminotransferase